jgi:hypothetical protein
VTAEKEDERVRDREPDLLELLIGHEIALKKLYDLFASEFPARSDLWGGLAGDEARHADLLGTLRTRQAVGQLLSPDGRLKPQAVKSSIAYVESQVARARRRDFSLVGAIVIAKDLETALIEKQFSKMDNTSAAEARPILAALAAETEAHRRQLVDALEVERRKLS